VSLGAIPERCGNRNAPTAMYASFVPPFHYDKEREQYIGGLFWDGRAVTLEDQAKGPFLNRLEMNNRKAALIGTVERSTYADMFRQVYGADAFANVDKAFDHVADAIAAYERTSELNPFSSKHDLCLAGKTKLTASEERGLRLFEDEKKGNCAECHPSRPDDGKPPLFTDFTHDNLGVPRNKDLPFYELPARFDSAGEGFIDLGLGGALMRPSENGKFRVPTLRNIAVTAPYMHNGVFWTLKDVVGFCNTRDSGKWGPPEVAENVNREELGSLKLSDAEIADLVAFMETLTDGYKG